MYHVARFVENGRVLVEVIASNWKINQKQILWPNVNKKKFEKYLKERREPDGSWLQISTTLLKQDIGMCTLFLVEQKRNEHPETADDKKDNNKKENIGKRAKNI